VVEDGCTMLFKPSIESTMVFSKNSVEIRHFFLDNGVVFAMINPNFVKKGIKRKEVRV